MADLKLPSSYASLPFKEIRLSHHPASSPSPTPIIILTLYRPKAANAFTPTMRTEMVQAYELIDRDDRVKCVVVTGHGKMFCAGADMNMGFQSEIQGTRAKDHRDGGGQVSLAIHRCTKPTIGALNGSAVGVGLTMTLPMAIRVASRDAKFGVVFARRGIVTDAASSYFLPRLLGYARAMHLVTTGAVYPATHDLWNGLFGEIVAPDQVLPRALALAEEVTQHTSMVSNKVIRDLMWRGPDDVESAHLIESEMLINAFRSKDHEEGRLSFLEKRAPEFKGSMQNDSPDAWPWYQTLDITKPADAKLWSSKL